MSLDREVLRNWQLTIAPTVVANYKKRKMTDTDNYTKIAKWIIKYLGITLFFLSLISLGYLIFESFDKYTLNFCKVEYFVTFIGLFSKFSGLYSATFVVVATYYALNQYIENLKSNNTSITQLQTQIQDINGRIESEKISLTMTQCKYFYDEIQNNIKEMYRSLDGILIINHLDWEINDFTEEDLFLQDRNWNNKFDQIPNNIRDKIILSISKLEIFSIYFIYGNADTKLGFNTVGKDFCKQVQNLYPLISIWRSRARHHDENFYNRTIELYRLWDNKLNEIKNNWPQHRV